MIRKIGGRVHRGITPNDWRRDSPGTAENCGTRIAVRCKELVTLQKTLPNITQFCKQFGRDRGGLVCLQQNLQVVVYALY